MDRSMINVPSAVRIFAYALPCDMRKSFDGLHAIVTNEFAMDVLRGTTSYSSIARWIVARS